MFYFGIDWSQAYHHLCLLNEAGARVSHIEVEHSPTGCAKIEHERCNLKVPASECLVGIETSYHPVVDFLLDCNYPVHIVPPRATNGYRNRQRGSGAYDDDSDAVLLASIMRTDRDSHPRLRRNTALTQQILAQVRLIESLRVSIQRQSNQLRAVLQRTYPEALGLFGDLTAQITLQFLMAYPTAAEASALSRDAFEAFCRQQGYTRTDLIPRRYAHLVAAAPSADPTVVRAHRYQVRVLAQVLLPQVRCRTQALAGLGHLFEQHPDAFIFASLPGAGPLLAPALLAKFGDQRDRFPAAESVQAQAGTCPVTERSGKRKKRVKFRHACDKEFRRIAQQFTRASMPYSGWAAGYGREIRPHCDSNSHAYRLVANRWLAIIWKLWQTRQAYDESYHLRQRALRRKPRR